MTAKFSSVAVVFSLLTVSMSAHAQQTNKTYRIGYLAPGPINESFRPALSDLGYIEGKNLAIEYRQGIDRQGVDRYRELAAELVGLKVDCIVAVGVAAARAAKQATSAIPIVMGNASDDPVRQGLVASLAQPGGNVTGIIDMLPDLAGKRLELLKETIPQLSHVAHLGQGGDGGAAASHLKETETAARALKVRTQALHVAKPDDLNKTFETAVKTGAQALIVVGTGFFIGARAQIIDLELKTRLPTMHSHGSWVLAGGLMSYATDEAARYRRAAAYVDKILRGTTPAALPVERLTKFELVINLKTAKQIGLAIPPYVLAKADKVVR